MFINDKSSQNTHKVIQELFNHLTKQNQINLIEVKNAVLEILGIEPETISRSTQSAFKGLPADLKMKCRTVLLKTREE